MTSTIVLPSDLITTSSKIKYLNERNLTIKEISIYLNIRYQHVYNVLKKEPNNTIKKDKEPSNKKEYYPVTDQQLLDFLKKSRFPANFDLYRTSENRYFARCQRSQFPHKTQEYFDVQSVIDEAVLFVKENCKCSK